MFSFWKKKDEFTLRIEKLLGFSIKNVHLYKEAFTHSSKKESYNYQRLEFLGDAVLSLIIADYLFLKYTHLPEGDLTKLRTKLVNKQILKDVALKLNLNQFAAHQLNPSELEKSSLYCDMTEALIGAIYLDKGIEYVKRFIKEKIIEQLNEVQTIEDNDYKSKIYILAQKHKWHIKFITEKIEKVNNENIFTISLKINSDIVASAKHYSKKQAEQMACKDALEKLNEDKFN